MWTVTNKTFDKNTIHCTAVVKFSFATISKHSVFPYLRCACPFKTCTKHSRLSGLCFNLHWNVYLAFPIHRNPPPKKSLNMSLPSMYIVQLEAVQSLFSSSFYLTLLHSSSSGTNSGIKVEPPTNCSFLLLRVKDKHFFTFTGFINLLLELEQCGFL